jgi:RNA recognition motif-containing protein
MENLKKLYIRNLCFDLNKGDVEKEFSRFGNIVECNVPPNRDNPTICRGYPYS